MTTTGFFTLADVKNYINSESFNAIELENILKEGGWFAGSKNDNFGTNGYDKLVMQENGKVELVQITPSNLDKSDIQAYIRREINQNNSVCMDDEGSGSAGIALIEPCNGENFIEYINDFSEPETVNADDITDSFKEFIVDMMGSMEDVYIYKLTKENYAVLVALYFV